MTPEDPIRVLVVDDHDLFRSGLKALLTEEGFVVADVSSGTEALRRLEVQRPDVVVMDLNMPELSGIETTRRIMERFPGLPVLMLTVSTEQEQVVEAVLAGASGYLLKDADLHEISAGVRAAAAGQAAIAPRVGSGLLARIREQGAPGAATPLPRPPAPSPSPLDALTDRERDVLRLVARGADNAEIAQQLHLSPSTVKSHLSAVYGKLGVENRVQAAIAAMRHGLLDS
jgi:DNA-binding NarL/FixJ family response regulator